MNEQTQINNSGPIFTDYTSTHERISGISGYSQIMFAWLTDKGEACHNLADCREILAFYLSTCKEAHSWQIYHEKLTEPTPYEFDLLVVFKRDEKQVDLINERIEYLNKVAARFGISTPIEVEEVGKAFVPAVMNLVVAYRLRGDRKWVSSAPLISFFTGIIKFGFENPEYKPIFTKFMDQFPKNYNITDDPAEIRAEFAKNFEFLGYSGTFRYGMESWLGNISKINEKYPRIQLAEMAV